MTETPKWLSLDDQPSPDKEKKEGETNEDNGSLANVGPSEPATEAEQTRKQIEFRKKNNELVLEWLINQGGISTGDAFFGKFKKVLEQDHEQDSEGIDQAAELLSKLPELFEQVDDRIAELGQDKTKYGKIAEKRTEMIKGICEPILNGHLTSEDGAEIISGIEIVSPNDPDKQALFEEAGIRAGYEGVAFFSFKERKIYLFDEALVDKYRGFKAGLDIKHLVTHEMSHGIVERSVKYNKELVKNAKKIIEKAEDPNNNFPDSQSQHIRNTLNGVKNADADFDKYFADSDHLAKSEIYKALPDEQKEQFKEAQRKIFITDRKIQAAAEILTDYTAMYLESDGSLDDFVLTCLKKSDKNAMKNYFGEDFKEEKLSRLNSIKDPKTKKALVNRLGTEFSDLVGTYKVFYDEIQRTMVANKGKFATREEEHDDEDDPFGEYSGAGFGESSSGFGQQENHNANGATGGGESIWSEMGALIKAMAGELPNVK